MDSLIIESSEAGVERKEILQLNYLGNSVVELQFVFKILPTFLV
jgi:hypothetical protein